MITDSDPASPHREFLIAGVEKYAREHPEVRLVALIVEADAPEAMSILQSEAEIHRAEDGTFSLLIQRDSAKQLLAQASPRVLDWLEDEAPGKIPVIHSARKGMRAGWFKCGDAI